MPSDLVEKRNQSRVLLLPPTARDAEAIAKVLTAVGLECQICSNAIGLCHSMMAGAGAVVISEEAMAAEPDLLRDFVLAQPMWSDLPFIVLARSGSESPNFAAQLHHLGNVTVLERPVRITTLLSVVQSSLRARARQYQARDHYIEREAFLASERAARSEAERASQLKDEFLATLSHELRTPLNAVLGWAQILAMGGNSAEETDTGINIILRNARAQAQIIEDLLDMSAIVSGKIRLEMQDVDLAHVVQAAVETVQPTAEVKSISIVTAVGPSPARVSGDPSRLQQVFWNLLSNAVKFTAKHGMIHVGLERIGSHLQVSVQDDGQGIKPEFLAHVFDRFRQENAATTRRVGGLGLGLSIVKQLVELHGGVITATSAGIGRGSTFAVNLPLRTVKNDAEVGGDAPAAIEPEFSLSGKTILVVDDEADARALLQRLLEDRGATVLQSGSAAEAFQIVSTESIDLLLSDIGMPDEDGYSLMRRVRQLPAELGGKVPALALTAYARTEDRTNAILAGFQRHLTKPIHSRELISTIAALMDET